MNLRANIVQRLFDEGHINAEEVIILLNDSNNSLNRNETITIPNTTFIPKEYNTNKIQSCKVCGIEFVDYMGNTKLMGFVCTNNNCPTKVNLNC